MKLLMPAAAASLLCLATLAAAAPAQATDAARPKPRTISVNVTSVFSTPKPGVECRMSRAKGAKTVTSIACNVLHAKYKLPPTPKACQGKGKWWGDIELTPRGAHFTCLPEPGIIGAAEIDVPQYKAQRAWFNPKTDVITSDDRVAPAAGSVFKGGNIVCNVGTKTLRCVDTKTKHGFDLSATRAKFF